MEFKARDPLIKIFFVAVVLFLVGLTYILADLEYRVGMIEHYIAHEKYRKAFIPCPLIKR
ncbi:MAG: hypothetical protein JW800_00630 [Candidatus Omnitrophica bacterium]|nr:hypothetical protein [Candidatus Omnitrophota bacterium]